MRLPKLASVFVFFGCLAAYLMFVKRHYDDGRPTISKIPPHFHPRLGLTGSSNRPTSSEVVSGRFQYGVMFDAGSTGTRIHVFKFQLEDNEAPKLAHESFRAIKPGLSAYADEPEKCKKGILELLDVAQSSIPSSMWNNTPVVLKATAGLRLLPGEKAKHLLDMVREVFAESAFLSRGDSVSIMDGTDEGMSVVSLNTFLYTQLYVQLNFSNFSQHIYQPFGHNSLVLVLLSVPLILSSLTHSYLGLGLMSARLAVLGGIEGQPLEGSVTELVSPCLAPDYSGQWEHADVVYTVKGQKAGEPIYDSCYKKVEKMLYNKVKQAGEAKDMEFYAFSYYYDRAVDLGVIDEKTGGTVTVSDYIDGAKRVCNGMMVTPGENHFLCLDLTYISVILQELGFSKDKVFKLARKINEVETSWALGATFHYIESFRRQ
uniref:nucleoside diphosphate phosphatase n=1 Tax=Esox lucius TaxID=8010 RepID=A0A3P9AAV1_ESOLU